LEVVMAVIPCARNSDTAPKAKHRLSARVGLGNWVSAVASAARHGILTIAVGCAILALSAAAHAQAVVATPHVSTSNGDISSGDFTTFGDAVIVGTFSAGSSFGTMSSTDAGTNGGQNYTVGSPSNPNGPLAAVGGGEADILAGNAGATGNVTMAWRTRVAPLETANTNSGTADVNGNLPTPNTTSSVLPAWAKYLASDVVQVRGVGGGGSDYVLQMHYGSPFPESPSDAAAGTTQTGFNGQVGALLLADYHPGHTGWVNSGGSMVWESVAGQWVNAVSDNIALPAGGRFEYVPGQGFVWTVTRPNEPAVGADAVPDYIGSWEEFIAPPSDGEPAGPGYGHTLAQLRSSWGVDPATDTVWAVLNTPGGGAYGVVPEPATPSLLTAGGLGMALFTWWRKRRGDRKPRRRPS
jgi:hypothetical protein